MATKKQKTNWMEDGDDAHFSDNPAVDKKTRKKWRAEEKNSKKTTLKIPQTMTLGEFKALNSSKKKPATKKYAVKK